MSAPLRRSIRSLALLTALGLGLAAADAFARAGGGEHYSPPSSGGGSSGGGGGGGGDVTFLFDILWFIFRITFQYPKVMIPLWILVIAGFWAYGHFNANATTKRGLRGADRARLSPAHDLQEALAELHARDPQFSVDAFSERTKRVFLALQDAWFRRRLDEARAYMSDGLHRRFVVLEKLMMLEGRRDAIADVQVHGIELLRAESSAAFDILTVRVDASMRDTDVPSSWEDDTARAAGRKAKVDRFEEVWTFLRRPDRQSKPEWDVSQGACPNCGAPFTGGQANKCEYCGAIVNSGAYDWVLSEITQVEAFTPVDADEAAGLADLRARDPNLAQEVVQDRASLLFWKWIEVWATSNPATLRQVSTPGAYAQIASELPQNQGRTGKSRIRVPAVGGTQVLSADSDGQRDRVHVDVRWSAALEGEGPNSASRPRRHVLTLVRQAGAKTADAGLSTDRCGNCAAPLTATDRTTCEYCGHDLTTAENDWLLEHVTPYSQWKGAAIRRPTGGSVAYASRQERARLLQVMAAVAMADGTVDRRERALLRNCASRWGVEWEQIEPILMGNVPPDLRPDNPARAKEILVTLIDMAKSDGKIDARERRLIEQMGGQLGLGEADVNALLG